MKAFLKKFASPISSLMGLFVAVAQAWITIDWKDFDIEKEWPKLALSATIAVGGFVTKLSHKDDTGTNV